MKVTHTPGPWTADETPGKYGDYWNREITDANDENVALVAVGTPDGEANARLIAAAPELLAALEGLVMAWAHGERLHHGDPQSFDDPIGRARLAIRKALSGSSEYPRQVHSGHSDDIIRRR